MVTIAYVFIILMERMVVLSFCWRVIFKFQNKFSFSSTGCLVPTTLKKMPS
jgi:hypothetical protein